MKILIVLIFPSLWWWGIVAGLSKDNLDLTVTVVCSAVGRILVFLPQLTSYFPVPGEPREVGAKPFNSSTVVVNWRAPADDKQNGVIRAYQIYIQPKNAVSHNTINVSSNYIFCIILNVFTRCYNACVISYRRVFTSTTASRSGSTPVTLMWPPTTWPGSNQTPNIRFRWRHSPGRETVPGHSRWQSRPPEESPQDQTWISSRQNFDKCPRRNIQINFPQFQ